jgi:hypothetical protein
MEPMFMKAAPDFEAMMESLATIEACIRKFCSNKKS